MSDMILEETDHKFLKDVLLRMRSFFALSIVRLHNGGEIDLYQIKTINHLKDVLNKIDVDDSYSTEIYITSDQSRLKSANLCLQSGDPESALIIVSSLIESEVNTLIRHALRLRNFSHGTITESLKTADLKTKIKLILPLLEIKIHEREKQIAFDQISVRNSILHFKASPKTKDSPQSEFEKVRDHVEGFFSKHPMDVIEKHFSEFVNLYISKQPHVSQAFHLFDLLND